VLRDVPRTDSQRPEPQAQPDTPHFKSRSHLINTEITQK
jgi:hypothetical protein